jgi:type IV secretory pathway TrbL component
MSWERDLAAALAGHDLVAAGYKLVADPHAVDRAQRAVVAAIDRAVAAGVPEATIDATLSRYAAETAARATAAENFPHERRKPPPAGTALDHSDSPKEIAEA